MSDPFAGHQAGLESPIGGAFRITPNDSTVFTIPTRQLYIGTDGNLNVRFVGGVTFQYVTGELGTGRHPMRVDQVLATGTTATGLIGEY